VVPSCHGVCCSKYSDVAKGWVNKAMLEVGAAIQNYNDPYCEELHAVGKFFPAAADYMICTLTIKAHLLSWCYPALAAVLHT